MQRLRPALPQINPIIVKEVRSRMRGARPYIILTVFLVVLVAAGYGIYQLVQQQTRFGSTLLSPQVGQALFNGLALCELFLVVFLAPALTSGAISGEREQLTYDMLVATPLHPTRILWGKLVAALSYLFLLIFAAIPLFSVVLMFGGVAPWTMFKALLLLIVTAITFGTLGLFCSTLFRRTATATVVSYALVLLLIAGTLMVGTFAAILGQPGGPIPPQTIYLNPFSAMMSILTVMPTGHSGPFFGGDIISGLGIFSLLTPGVIFYGPNGPVIIPIIRATLVIYPLLVVALCWVSAHLVLPRNRWRLRRGDLGFALTLTGLLLLAWLTRDWWFVLPPPLP